MWNNQKQQKICFPLCQTYKPTIILTRFPKSGPTYSLWPNSLWPSDAIRRQGTELTLAQVMASCLTASSHYLNQCWFRSAKHCGIHRRASSWEDLKMPISKIRFKIPFFRIAFRSPKGQWVKASGKVTTTASHGLLQPQRIQLTWYSIDVCKRRVLR